MGNPFNKHFSELQFNFEQRFVVEVFFPIEKAKHFIYTAKTSLSLSLSYHLGQGS